jgi:hypothetical protein
MVLVSRDGNAEMRKFQRKGVSPLTPNSRNTSEEVDPLNACAPGFVRGLNPESMLVAIMAINKWGKEVQCVGVLTLRSDNLKMALHGESLCKT